MIRRRKRAPRRLNLALQGGGAHGAFTWGVLERLLQEPQIEIGWISGTSAGAVNAAAVASGLAKGGTEGGRERAIETLTAVWTAVAKARVPDLLRLNPFIAGFTRAAELTSMAGVVSPYEFNPLGFDPLRNVLNAHVDFAAIRAGSPVELLIAATDVSTGRRRLFRSGELGVEMVLASACLPTLHHAVMIEGRAYWDGGFSANPDLTTLAGESPVEDTLIVQLNPLVRRNVPRTAREIAAHVNGMTFNNPYLREVEAVVLRQEQARHVSRFRRALSPRNDAEDRLYRHRFHLIEAGRYTAGLDIDSKVRPDHGLLAYLHGAGRTEAHKWCERHRLDIGEKATVDLRTRVLEREEPKLIAPGEAPPAITDES